MAVEGRTHVPIIDNEKCKNCDLCRLLCPDLCITTNEETGKIIFDTNYCKGCGLCAMICPTVAISMVLENIKINRKEN